jgi:hypothetical protein
LVASEPDIVTPTGIAVDEHGAIWVVENQTHQRTPQYKGPKPIAFASSPTSAPTAGPARSAPSPTASATA